MSVSALVDSRVAAAPDGGPRDGAAPSLIVIHSDPRPAEAALAAYLAPGAATLPHYHLAADGRLTSLVGEDRAAPHSGLALHNRRWRNIDRISVGVAVEHSPGAPFPAPALARLHDLVADLAGRHGIAGGALYRWSALSQGGGGERGVLLPLALPLAPAETVFAGGYVLGGAAEASPEDGCVPPELPAEALLLGGAADAAADPARAERRYIFLLNEAYRQRAEGFQLNWAFHRFAPQRDLGAALARSSDNASEISFGGKRYGFQVFAGDTIFNEIPKWTAVQRMGDLLGGKIPASGLGRLLLEATYRATGQALQPGWRFHLDAVAKGLGPPLSGSYVISAAGREVNLQVFAGDTLYSFPPNFGQAFALSETAPGALADALWAETYKPSGAAYDQGSALQQRAQSLKIGAPLSGVYQASFEGEPLTMQVFARDVLFIGPDGVLQRLSELAKPGLISDFVFAPAAAPAAGPGAPPATQPSQAPDGGSPADATGDRVPTFLMLPIAGQPRISQFYGFTKYSRRRTDIYGQTQARHTGLDFAVAEGTPLLSVAHGLVVCAGGAGACPFGANKPGSIVVRYGAIYAVYGHARSTRVRKGQLVAPGDVLGESGTFVGPHLHFELRPVPAATLPNQSPDQSPVNPGRSVNPIVYFSQSLRPYFEAQYARLRGSEGEFCIGGLYDQPDTTFGGPLDQRPCTN